jgi:tryptophanyl-tRNA synthetase
MKKIITGIKSTGSSLHLGNLMGAVLPLQNISKGNDTSLFIADLHSLTSVKDGETLRHQTFEIAVEYFAILGLDTDIRIFRQSDIRDITKLMWTLCNVTPYSLMLRAHSFKDFQNKQLDHDEIRNQEMEKYIQDFIHSNNLNDLSAEEIQPISDKAMIKYFEENPREEAPQINM